MFGIGSVRGHVFKKRKNTSRRSLATCITAARASGMLNVSHPPCLPNTVAFGGIPSSARKSGPVDSRRLTICGTTGAGCHSVGNGKFRAGCDVCMLGKRTACIQGVNMLWCGGVQSYARECVCTKSPAHPLLCLAVRPCSREFVQEGGIVSRHDSFP